MSSRPHGDLLKRKARERAILVPVLAAYEEFVKAADQIKVTDEAAVFELVAVFNAYRKLAIHVFEDGDNVPQENLRSSITEEFLGWLFKDVFSLLDMVKPENAIIGKAVGSYLSLDFAPRTYVDMFKNPGASIHTKDQDFAIGGVVSISISAAATEVFRSEVALPVVAIECKTYLAKNHLDMCASTARNLHKAVPYCMYIILTEFLKMDSSVTPEFTEISEIYVLCKAKNTERAVRKRGGMPPHDVYADVVYSLFCQVVSHLRAIWWDPKSAIERGRVIGR